jgi:hypothetical protein
MQGELPTLWTGRTNPRMAINPSPTQFPELNALLSELTERAHGILADNFVGAYLQGSFAVGDADMHSDCDFLIPVNVPICAEQEAGLRALHDEIPARPGHWTHHIEGSYPNRDELRTLSGLGRKWLYIDHGSREMEWSSHCNSEVVRWSLRECGITLAGPDPKTLVGRVGPDVLRAKMRESAKQFLPEFLTWSTLENAWGQRYAVTTFCRILHTLDSGRVMSKKAALLWARDNLGPEWAGLIQQVTDDRADPSMEPTRPGEAEAAVAFAGYAKARAANWSHKSG